MLKEKLHGLSLSIIDDTIVENLLFSVDQVIATIGVQNGYVCGPILEFEITGEDSLVIDKTNFNIVWEIIKFEENVVSVIRNGTPTHYEIVSNAKNPSKINL